MWEKTNLTSKVLRRRRNSEVFRRKNNAYSAYSYDDFKSEYSASIRRPTALLLLLPG